jgi:adenylate cyclase
MAVFRPLYTLLLTMRFNSLLRNPVFPMLAMSIGIVSGTILAERAGLFESIELNAYDTLVRLQPARSTDPRLLIVGVTEADLYRLNASTPSDRTLADAISILQKSQPSVIGLDFYRDLPQGEGQALLKKAFQANNVLVIHRASDNSGERIPPPADIPPERVGFNDTSVDRDGVVRRALLFAGDETAFALQAAFMYLETRQIQPRETPGAPGIMTLGKSTFWPIDPTIGNYRHADTRGHQILLNYRNVNVAPRVTLTQLLNHSVSPDLIRDRVILIGNMAVSSKDYFYSPYSPDQIEQHQMSGVEVHGQVISQILDAAIGQRPLRQGWPDSLEVFWIAGWGLISAIWAWRARQVPPWAISHLLLSGLPLVMSFGALYYAGVWIPTITPAICAVISGGGVMGYRAQMLQRQNRMAMTLLGQNTSPKVAQTLWENRHSLVESGQLTGQQAIATMLFADLRGFSGISEILSPSDLMRWLNEYLGSMTEDIHANQGIVNKFIGDGIFAVFGVPIVRNDAAEIAQDAHHAVTCALAMARRLDQLNVIWEARGLDRVQMRIGICTGTVVVGSLGSRDRSEYGVIGDAVNTASRLESCHKERQTSDCRILISESTQEYLDQYFQSPASNPKAIPALMQSLDLFNLEPWGMLELKGKQQRVNVYHLQLPQEF